ncbi:MAG: CocE/NonD family hydrolase [Planctomycetota bacterium]
MPSTTILSICCTLLIAPEAAELGVSVERNVPAEMRDGTILRADVHRPDRGGPYPVLVMRTPYGKGGKFDRFVKAGYIVVAQDARGRYASDGKWESFLRFETHDAEDGYDTVEWAAKLPGSTGKVGTFGASYNAFMQWRLAPLRPPSLVAMSALSILGRYTDLEGPGTIRPGRRLQWWMFSMSPDMRKRSGRQVSDAYAKIADRESQPYLWFLPWLDLPRGAFEDETEAVHYWLKNPHTDPWKLDEGVKEIAVPNFDVVGWHDHCNGDMLLYKTMVKEAKTETARKGSRILIGPWSHAGRGRRRYDNVDFGPEAQMDVLALQIRWFDYWLKGKENGVDKDAPVKIFIMGEGRWRDEQHWPLDRTQDKILFITSGGHANTPAGDGKVVDEQPDSAGSDRYVYDPANPVLTLHGKGSFTHASDQRPLADREDILVYQSEPLTERIEVTGNPVVELYAASSAPDTDWFVRLIDVAPDGLARDVSLGLVRARYREGLDKPKLLTPGEVVKYAIRMNATSNAFLPGHRIRLDVTSSDFPNYDRNHNTAADQNADATLATATQTIHHGGPNATRIILPQVPNAEAE